MRAIRFVLLLAGLAAWFGPVLLAQGPNRVNVAFSQASFPDVAMSDVRAAMALWTEEVTRNVKGIDTFTTRIYPSVDAMVEAMREGTADIAVLPTIEYFKVERRLDADLGFVSSQGTGGYHRFLLVVQAGLPAQQLRDLKGLRLCHVTGDTLGLLFLNHALLQQRLPEMDRFFVTVETRAKGSQALTNVFFGRTDACLVTEEAYRITVAMNPQIERKVRILAVSSRMYGALAVYRKGYPASLRQRVLEAVNELKRYPRGAQILNLFQASEIQKATEADLAESRRLYREYRQMNGRLL